MYRIVSPLSAFAVLALTAVLIAGCGEKPDAMIASAKDYLAKNDRSAAVIQLKNALQKEPNLVDARMLLGTTYLEMGDAAAAEKELRRAFELKAPESQVVPLLAEAEMRTGNPKKVIDEFSGIEIAEPAAKSSLQAILSQAYLALGNIDAATAASSAALLANPDNANALLGQAYLKAGAHDAPGALAAVDAALAKAPKLIEALQFKGDLLRSQGQVDAALAMYGQANAATPNYVPAHAATVSLLAQEGKLDEAAAALEKLQKIAPKHPQTLYLKALLAYKNKDFAAAHEAIQGHLQMIPDSLQGLLVSGAIDFEMKSYPPAEASLLKVIQRAPDQILARRILAATYLRQRQYAKALETLKPALEAPHVDPEVAALAGEAYMQKGDIDRAGRLFEAAAKDRPQNTRTRTALAMTRMAQGDSERAFRELETTAAADTGTQADLALIVASLRKRDYSRALTAIDALEKKQPDSPLPQNLRGVVLLAKRDFASARASFEKATVIDPTYVPAAVNLAQLDVAEKKPDDAAKRFDAVLQKDPQNIQALLALAELRARAGASTEEVAGLIGKAIAANPKSPTPRLALVALYLRGNAASKAIAAAQEGVSALPDSPDLLHALGRAQQATGDPEAAIATYGKLVLLQPNSALPLVRLAEAQMQAKNPAAAMQSLRKALAIQPDFPEAQRALMGLEIAAGRPNEALTIARDIQKRRPKDPLGLLLEGDVRASQKAWKEAIAAYRAALKFEGRTDIAVKLDSALRVSGATAEADRFEAGWTKDHASDAAFRRYLGEFAITRRDYPAALTHFRSALAIEPNNAQLLNNMAWVSAQLHDPKALAYAEQADKLVPGNPAIMDTLGNILVDKGETARGLQLLENAAKGAPQDPAIRLNYARALIKAGQKDLAKKELEALQQLGNKFGSQTEVAELLKGL